MILYLVWLSLVISTHEAFKILVVFPRPSKSHSILGDSLVRHLLNDGHEVTYISPFPFKSGSPNLRVIDVSSNIEVVPMTILKFETVMNKEVDVGNQALFISAMINMADFTIQNDNVQKLLNNPMERFDLVIAEWVFTDLLSGLAAVFDCPYIWISNLDIHWMLLRLIDQPTNPAYTSDIISYNLPPFTFWQRVTELYTQIEGQIFRYMYFNDMERRIYENSLAPIVLKRGRQPPLYYDIQYNSSLIFANSHVSLGQAVSIPQNCIPIGGFHIEENVKPLPKDIKKIMDDAQHGVIYFSMGSNLRSKDIPKVMKDSFLRLFGELKQTVLWKFEEDLPNKPKNVYILNWAPQQSILAHPNTVLFITHGGLLSITETIHFGVPIIGIPAFADQFVNVARAVNRGFACKVELSYEMADKLKEAIEEVITNSKYAKKARELSFIYHNRPVTPGREILFWVRHVIETRGAVHLRSPALNVPLYQKLYLDLLVIILIVLYLIIKLINHIRNATCTIKNLDSKKKL